MPKSWKKATNRTGCDVVFEASGAPVVFNQAMQLLKQNGRFGPVGRPVRFNRLCEDI
ncbi:MAG: zinc-binding dehydrogenase [[Clostridium] innocuum]